MLIKNLLIPFCLLLAVSCKSKSGDKNTINGKDSLAKTDSNNADGTNETEKKLQELGAMDPLTTSALEKLAPAELMGVTRTNMTSNTAYGTAMVMAYYDVENNSGLKLTLMDCGGTGGAGAYSALFVSRLNENFEEEKEYSRTIEYYGVKALEHLDKTSGFYHLTWFAQPRYLISLEGNDLDIIKQVGKGLKIQ